MATGRILANDGIHPAGKEMLENAGFEVVTDKVAQEDLDSKLPEYEVILVRSATKVRQPLIDACPNLKIIGRGGVGLDNIDVDYAKSKGIEVYNTPAASSRSVAELVLAHALDISRFMHNSNRDMPQKGTTEFKSLKKSYAAGIELKGKTMGIIGFGRIGQEVGKIAVGLGMKVLAHDPFIDNVTLNVELPQLNDPISIQISTSPLEEVLSESDFLTLHVPSQDKPVIGAEELSKMKPGAVIINASRGGIIDEKALVAALDNGHLSGAGLDVFTNEPTPSNELLTHPKISVTPHTGASTEQAQANIGTELAAKIIDYFGKEN